MDASQFPVTLVSLLVTGWNTKVRQVTTLTLRKTPGGDLERGLLQNRKSTGKTSTNRAENISGNHPSLPAK
jgi:hypothetical protein